MDGNNKNKLGLTINLVAKDMLSLEVTPYSSNPVHKSLIHKLVKSLSVIVKFGQDITWVVLIKITQLLALHLVAKYMLPLEVTP